MSRDTRRYLVTLAILAMAAVAVLLIHRGEIALGRELTRRGYTYIVDVDHWRRTERERAVQSPYDFSLERNLNDSLPLTIGEWQGRDVPLTNLEALILLEPDQYVQRLYTLPNGRYLWLSLIGSRKSKSFHSPQICYTADGWSTDASSEAIPLKEGEIYALRLVATKPLSEGFETRHVVLYFYLWPNTARDNSQGLVLFKTTSPLYGSLEETLEMHKAFIRQFFYRAEA
ncbi:MAG TPA: exosortase-associated EpsI family protein [Caldilineae bacterium]|nr:exosortase-associated EpsI family protein [Caldilineae bacterium]